MVNLMLQPVFMNLVKGSTDHKMTSDDLYNMWAVASRTKSAIVQGRRLENLSWRLWYTSTIRAKYEMEEKQKLKKKEKIKNSESTTSFSDGSISGEISSADQYPNNQTDESSNDENHHHHRKGQDSESKECNATMILPSDRPLFTSTCTSILAEIQDASFRFGQSGGNGMVGTINFTNLHNYNNFTNQNPFGHGQNTGNSHLHNNIVSPPTTRSKSPANNFTLHSKKKKNVEKFLKKFKSNLEDITEQFDEKLAFTDDDTNNEEEHHNNNKTNNITHDITGAATAATEGSLSPTNSINNFATDEEGPDSTFYSGHNDFISIKKYQKASNTNNQISMISKLLKKEEYEVHSINRSNSKINTEPEPIHRIPPAKFLYGSSTNQNNSNSDSFINSQLELMATNRYVRFPSTSMTIKSPKPPAINLTDNTSKRIIDANALSSSLSANKFKLEDGFDSQIFRFDTPSSFMAAKKQVERKLHNPEAHERINYLLHIATSMVLIVYNSLIEKTKTENDMDANTKKYFTPAYLKTELKDAIKLSQTYVKILREVAKKSVIRLAPNTKRCLCKKCNCILLPSITSKIRYTRRKGRQWTSIRCIQCGNVERFLIPNDPFKSNKKDEIKS